MGVKVVELFGSDEKKQKEEILKKFLKSSSALQEKLDFGEELLRDYSYKLRQHYEDEKEYINRFDKEVAQIIDFLEQSREKMKETFDARYEENKAKHREFCEVIEECRGVIEKFESDIKNNFTQITCDMEMENVELILKDYKNDYRKYQEKIRQLKSHKFLLQSYPKVDTEEVFDVGRSMTAWFTEKTEKLKCKRLDEFEHMPYEINGADLNSSQISLQHVTQRHRKSYSAINASSGIDNINQNIHYSTLKEPQESMSLAHNKARISFGDQSKMISSAIEQSLEHPEDLMKQDMDTLERLNSHPTHHSSLNHHYTGKALRQHQNEEINEKLQKIQNQQDEKKKYWKQLMRQNEEEEELKEEEGQIFEIGAGSEFVGQQTPDFDKGASNHQNKLFEQMRMNAMNNQEEVNEEDNDIQEATDEHFTLQKNRLKAQNDRERDKKLKNELFKYIGPVDNEESVDEEDLLNLNGTDTTGVKCQKILFGGNDEN